MRGGTTPGIFFLSGKCADLYKRTTHVMTIRQLLSSYERITKQLSSRIFMVKFVLFINQGLKMTILTRSFQWAINGHCGIRTLCVIVQKRISAIYCGRPQPAIHGQVRRQWTALII